MSTILIYSLQTYRGHRHGLYIVDKSFANTDGLNNETTINPGLVTLGTGPSLYGHRRLGPGKFVESTTSAFNESEHEVEVRSRR